MKTRNLVILGIIGVVIASVFLFLASPTDDVKEIELTEDEFCATNFDNSMKMWIEYAEAAQSNGNQWEPPSIDYIISSSEPFEEFRNTDCRFSVNDWAYLSEYQNNIWRIQWPDMTRFPEVLDTEEPEPEPDPIPDSESLQQQKKQQEKLRVQEIVLADIRGTENKINAIKEYRDEFETNYFLEQFIHTHKGNYEKDRLMNFIYGEWGYQPTENTSANVIVYFRSYENYDHIEKINEWQKPKDSAFLISPDSDGYLMMDLHGMPPAVGIHETCVIPGEYRVSASNPYDESKVEWGYFTCQRDKLVGESQPWMELPD